jgi:hypothetical protein
MRLVIEIRLSSRWRLLVTGGPWLREGHHYVNNKIDLTVKVLLDNNKKENQEGRFMATPGQLMDEAAEVTGSNRSTVESLYNHLRDAGEIPKGARGKNALRVTSTHAAKLLIAICKSEHVKDAADAVRRYSGLDAGHSRRHPLPKGEEIIVPGPQWKIVTREFPRLGKLKQHHCLIHVLVALIDSYVDDPDHAADVTVSFGSPYPWAEASVVLEKRDDAEWRVSVTYRHANYDEEFGEEDDPDFLALIDPSKERQRRKFSKLGGDLNITAKITDKTLRALGELLRDEGVAAPVSR